MIIQAEEISRFYGTQRFLSPCSDSTVIELFNNPLHIFRRTYFPKFASLLSSSLFLGPHSHKNFQPKSRTHFFPSPMHAMFPTHRILILILLTVMSFC